MIAYLQGITRQRASWMLLLASAVLLGKVLTSHLAQKHTILNY